MAKAAKNNFWNDERERRGWSLKYIAKRIGVPQSTVGAWFSGVKAPRNDHHIEQLCKLFEIPFDKGYNEFYNEERKWDSSRRTMHYYNTYWNDLREKNNLSLDEISEMTGIPPASISKNFIGANVPRKSAIEKYCKLFEIPFDEAKEKFKEAHAQYVAAQNPQLVDINTTPPIDTHEEEKEKEKEEEVAVNNYDIDYTFWPSIFANASFSTKDIASYLNVDESKVEKYFTGEVIPNFNQLRALCGLYGGINMTDGKNAFELLHNHFLENPSAESTSDPAISNSDMILKLMEMFYDEVTYPKFMKIQSLLNNMDDATLKIIYETYSNISSIINS